MTNFDRKGRCPICRKEFQGTECPHDYWYVVEVIRAAKQQRSQFSEDVRRLRRGKKK